MDNNNQVNEDSGLTNEEALIVRALVQAWNSFNSLAGVDAVDRADFCRAINTAQRIMAYRVVRRHCFQFWR